MTQVNLTAYLWLRGDLVEGARLEHVQELGPISMDRASLETPERLAKAQRLANRHGWTLTLAQCKMPDPRTDTLDTDSGGNVVYIPATPQDRALRVIRPVH